MPNYVTTVDVPDAFPLAEYRDFPGLSPLIDEIELKARKLRRRMRRRRVYMLNSTATGGGVAEMMPTLISLFKDLRIPVSWLVMTPQDPAFFLLTKKIHHLMHGRTDGGDQISKQEKEIYLLDSQRIAEHLEKIVQPNDLLVVHDPQPLGAGALLAEKRKLQRMLWRCHIGTEFPNRHSRHAWRFLRPYFDRYRQTFFTHPEYVPSFLKKKSAILYPAIDPLSDKNVWLSTEDHVDILRMARLYGTRLKGFIHPVKQLCGEGKLRLPQKFDPFNMPIILQISRWDHLKGFIPLMEGFLHMKRKAKASHYRGLQDLTRKMIRESVLVLAGPEIGTVADDPEPAIVIEEIKRFYQRLDPKEQQQIYIFQMPMTSRKENALITNALQRTAEVIVQNSIREGFGLTVTEALWKEVPVLATGVGGIRLQVKDNETGVTIKDPLNEQEVCNKLLYLLTHKRERMSMARRGWLHTIENYLMPVLLRRYLDIFEQHL